MTKRNPYQTTRRGFLGGTAALGAAAAGGFLLQPGRALAASPRERTFLFFFAGG